VAKRSPILGYNHNVRHRGLLFHVQTEDSGVDNPHIFTHLFHGGVIIASRKLEYDRDSAEEVVKALMQAQHKASLKSLKAGTFDDKISSYLADQPGLEPASPRRAARDTLESMAPPLPHSQVATPTPIRPPEPPPLAPLGEGSARGSQHPVESEMRATAPSQTKRTDDVSAAFRLIKREPTEPAGQPDVMSRPAPPVARQRPGSQTGYSIHRTGQLELMPEIHDQPTAPIARGKGRVAGPAPVAPRPPQPAARPVGKAATHSPPRPPSRAEAPAPVTPVSRGSVVVSRPPVIVGAPTRLGPRDVAPPAPRTIRRARESTRPSLFGKDLISERSLDEVILAYLSEDAAEK
jgi:hypothetical protein